MVIRSIFCLRLLLACFSLVVLNYHAAVADQLVVKKVYNGDSIKLAGDKKIKYIGVTAPGRGKLFYEFCKNANESLVVKKEISFKTDVVKMDEDEGKLLAYVYVNDIFVNAHLIKNGYVLAQIQPPNDRYKDLFLSLQKEARQYKRGLWAFEDQNNEPYYIGSKRKKVFHRPACFHAKHLDFDERIILRSKDAALEQDYIQDWRCSPLFSIPEE